MIESRQEWTEEQRKAIEVVIGSIDESIDSILKAIGDIVVASQIDVAREIGLDISWLTISFIETFVKEMRVLKVRQDLFNDLLCNQSMDMDKALFDAYMGIKDTAVGLQFLEVFGVSIARMATSVEMLADLFKELSPSN